MKRSIYEIVRDFIKGPDTLFMGGPRPYYVLYQDGQRSMSMDWYTANNYAEIFNGEVCRNEKYYEQQRD